MKGVANVRGNLFTVADLSEFCGETPIDNDLRARLIAINLPEVNCGVLVNEVLGMRQFDVGSVEETDADMAMARATANNSDPVAMAMRRVFRHEGVAWQEFDFRALVASAGFQDVAA
jgi:twitching motility protein PilI